MKKCFSLFVILILVVFGIAPVYAVENISPDGAVPVLENKTSQDVFSVIVTSSGKVIGKPGAVFTEGGNYDGLTLPYLASDPKPIVYPVWAVRQGWQGKVDIAIEVLINGKVGKWKVMKSSGHQVLDDQAVKAVRGWEFHPAVKEGKVIVTCIQIPVIFQLD